MRGASAMTAVLDPEARINALLDRMKPEDVPGLLKSLPPQQIPLIERVISTRTGRGWRADPLSMAERFGVLRRMPHTELLSRKFVDAVRGRSVRQIWNLPARYGKSIVASRYGPAWAFDDDPTIKIALGSYGKTLAQENGSAVRDLLVQHQDVLRPRLHPGRRRNDRFLTTQGGGLIAAGVGSALTGFGANGIVVDDPFKDSAEAHSEARRLLVWNWYRSVVRTRLEDRPDAPGWIIVVMTRWHEDDLTGMLLQADLDDDGEEWELIRLPAIAEETNPLASQPWMRTPDLLGRAPGDVLAPDLYPLKSVLARAKSLGSYITAGMEQQRPAPEEGTDILRSWWKHDVLPPNYDVAITSWDMKLKDKETGDFVVGQAWGRTQADYWCMDQLRGQWNMPTTMAAIALLAVRNPQCGAHIIENTGNGPEVMAALRAGNKTYELSDDISGKLGMTKAERIKVQNVLRNGMTGLIAENPKGDKRARMRAQTPKIEAGNVHLKLHANWVQGFVDEMASFPTGAHDDQVDACSQGLKRLTNAEASFRTAPSNRRIGKPKPGARAVPGVGRVRIGPIARPRSIR